MHAGCMAMLEAVHPFISVANERKIHRIAKERMGAPVAELLNTCTRSLFRACQAIYGTRLCPQFGRASRGRRYLYKINLPWRVRRSR
jgi:hypothetical protein